MDYTDACTDVGDRRQRHDSCLRRKNLVDGLPFDPADREKQVVYISTLGELLSYTFDFFDGNGTMYLQYKLYNEYSVFFNFGNFGKTYNTAPNNHGKTQNAEPAACNKMQKQEQNIKCGNFMKNINAEIC